MSKPKPSKKSGKKPQRGAVKKPTREAAKPAPASAKHGRNEVLHSSKRPVDTAAKAQPQVQQHHTPSNPTTHAPIKKDSSTMPKTSAAKNRTSFKDVEIAFLLDGVDGVQKLKANRTTIRKAVQSLQSKGKNADALSALAPASGRGRSMPSSGSERRYRAQQIKTGGAFLRTPLNTIGVKKGGLVSVKFEPDRIIIMRADVLSNGAAA